jgi:plastocyanin
MPLPLAVKTPEDLAFKAASERQYLIFNLLAGGKLAWDRGDYPLAATRWEALLRLPNLPPELEAQIRPLAKAAREQAPMSIALALPAAPDSSVGAASVVTVPEVDASKQLVTVSGMVGGGGSNGPGGAVIILRRAEGPTPKPKAMRIRAIIQKDKRFIPHVLAVPLGATVEFRNDDEIFHNVFSLTPQNDFDLGLYKNGASKEQSFVNPGPVHLLCNIHSSMNGYVYVSDSPWFTQADATGRFSLKGVPPGNYVAEVWHEWAVKTVKKNVRVITGMEELQVTIDGDRRPPAFVPDKSGKPRQPQLGY